MRVKLAGWGIILFGYLLSNGEILTLSDAELKAVSCSYEVRSSYCNQIAKEWEKRNAIANYLPRITLESGFNRIDDTTYKRANPFISSGPASSPVNNDSASAAIANMFSTFFGGMSSSFQKTYRESFSHKITAIQPLTTGGVEFVAIKMSKETEKAIEIERNDLELQVIYSTRKAYFDCLTILESLDVLKEDFLWTRQNLNKSRIRYQAGAAPQTDVLQFESDSTKKTNEIDVANALYKSALNTLYHNLGVSISKVNDSIQFQPVEVFEKWYQRGKVNLTYNNDSIPQLQALKLYTEVSRGSRNITLTQFFPSLSAFFSLAATPTDRLFNDEVVTWAAGVSMNLTLFSGFRNTTAYKKADYEYKKAQIDLQKTENQILLNLERIHSLYNSSYDGVTAALRQVSLMKKQLEIMQQRYEGGLASQLELSSVALGARTARTQYVQKLFECLLYETEYLRYTGKLEVYR